MATCKECLHHSICKDRENLMLTVNNIFELMYQDGVQHSCVHFKPTANVFEVVRCKDCVFGVKTKGAGIWCSLNDCGFDKDGFCSYGER